MMLSTIDYKKEFLIIITITLLLGATSCSVDKNMIVDAKFVEEATQKQNENNAPVSIPEIVVFSAPDFGSRNFSKILNTSYSFIGDYWNDHIKSIIVKRGTWEVYQFTAYSGKKIVLGPGYYNLDVITKGLDNKVASIKCIDWGLND